MASSYSGTEEKKSHKVKSLQTPKLQLQLIKIDANASIYTIVSNEKGGNLSLLRIGQCSL